MQASAPPPQPAPPAAPSPAAPSSTAPPSPPNPTATSVPAAPAAGTSVLLPIAAIDPNPWNRGPVSPRPDPDDLALTHSIARHGVQSNLLVRPAAAGRYQLIFGERRLRCATAAGLTEVPAVVRALDDHEARVLTLTENLHRRPLTFLQEADAVAGLIDERWTTQQVAAELGKPLGWVARRRRLLNLSPTWRQLADKREGFTAVWCAADFEQIAILEPAAQDDLLATNRPRLERCSSARELAQLIRSLTRAVRSFPWPADDAELDPIAGPCSACPRRSSQHPGLFDDQRDTEAAPSPATPRTGKHPRAAPDRCLDPVCAARKARLFLERKLAALTARHPHVHLLQEGWLPTVLPGALRDWEVVEVRKGTRGAQPAVIANGANLGQVRWIKPPQQHARRPAAAPAVPSGPQRASLAERQERKWRQRKIHALGLLRDALAEHAPPDLAVSVRLAIVFGTVQTHSSAAYAYDSELPLHVPGMDLAQVRRQMLGFGAIPEAAVPQPAAPPGSAGSLSTGPAAAPQALASGAAPVEDPALPEDPSDDRPEPFDRSSHPAAEPLHPAAGDAFAGDHGAARFWRAFDALDGRQPACAEFLWARTLRVMLRRMSPNGDPHHVDVAWNEGVRVAALAGLEAQTFLDQATAALPDPKSWAREAAAAERAPAAGAARATHPPAPPSPDPADTSPARPHRRPRTRRAAVEPPPPSAALPAGAA